DSFEHADVVLVYSPLSLGVGSHEQTTHQEIVERLRATGMNTIPIRDEKGGLSELKKLLKADDLVLIMTSGDMGGLVESIPTLAEKLFPN
ncbi:hypothetical protein GOV10_04155, partial [Candidatus Woesearchaeota archaeon]|nr:hypothetical protein [Candidatus Woesearchaeota archaeon]